MLLYKLASTVVTVLFSTRIDQPILRGKIHLLLLYLSPIWISWFYAYCNSVRSVVAATVAVCSIFYNFFASALLHNVAWSPSVRDFVNKLDHAGIFVMIAGCCAPVPLLLFDSTKQVICLALQWGSAISGILYSFFGEFSSDAVEEAGSRNASRHRAIVYVAMGLTYALFVGHIVTVLTSFELFCMFSLAVSYIGGAYVYAHRAPDPFPKVYGFHEIFHTCCLAAAIFTFCMDCSVLRRAAEAEVHF